MGPPVDSDSFLASLSDLLRQDACAVRPLDEARYVDAHRAFERASTQQSQIRRVIEAEARHLLRTGASDLDVLSVGCGCGMLDAPFLAHVGDHVRSFVGVDPNPVALDQCRQALEAGPGPLDYQLKCTQIEDFHGGRRYDLIYCSHVFYYVDNPSAVLDTLRALRHDTGTLVIAHAPKGCLNALAQAFWPGQGAGEDFYAPALRRLLMQNGDVAPVSNQIDARSPRALFDDATPQGTLLLEFLIQAQWAPLSAEVKTAVGDYLDRSADAVSSGQRLLPHPVTTFAVRGTASGL